MNRFLASILVALMLSGCMKTVRNHELLTSNQKLSSQNGAEFFVKEIYFDKDQASLRSDAIAYLKEAASIMKQYPNLRVELAGTRSVSESDAAIGKLRAISSKKYLIEQGISKDRLTLRNLDITNNVACNNRGEDCEEGNRRVMFRNP
jgi:outer membrane protein OmpA-like peptidoglycan-associated protein